MPTGYIGKLQIDNGDVLPIGSTLFGKCYTLATEPAKVVQNTSISPDALGAAFSTLLNGVTVHIQFESGNSVVNNLTLKIAETDAKPVLNPGGSCMWAAGAVVSFTYDGSSWVCNDSTTASIPIESTYNENSANAISGQGVKDALEQLGDASEKDTVTSIIDNGANNNDTVPTTSAVVSYIATKTAGITGAMHFKGTTTTTMSDGLTTPTVVIGGSNYTPNSGDVVLSGEHQEYVWTETNTTTHAGYWELLGDEGSYLLASSVQNKQVIDSLTFTQGTLPTITLDADATNVLTGITNASGDNQARVTSAAVQSGVLKITTGVLQQFNTSTVKGVTSVTEGTLPTLTPSTTQVLQAVT